VRLSTRNQVAGTVAVTVLVKSTEVTVGVED
jgi:molybdopterin-binding protein